MSEIRGKLMKAAMTLFASIAFAAPGLADEVPSLVTDVAMCPLIAAGEDVQEMGMVLNPEGMFEIEYFCEFSELLEISWHEERTITRTDYCAEPGLISPTVFAFQMSDYEPGVVYVWQQGLDEATVFNACREG